MPNYEPTPRRFSTLSVPQTPSRKASFDDTTRPSLAGNDGPVFPSLASPLDLSEVLKRLQQTNDASNNAESPDGEAVERGRSRYSTGHRRSATAWSHHNSPGIQIPSARKRENSASTRERIAMWEERSRSQSKGRSKSRGRDLGHRVSVVPEMPELPASFAVLGSSEDAELKETEKNGDGHGQSTTSVEAALQGLEGHDATSTKAGLSLLETGPGDELLNTSGLNNKPLNEKDHAAWSDSPVSGAVEFSDAPDKETVSMQQFQSDTRAWVGHMAHSPPQSPELDPKTTSTHQVGTDERPRTPVRTIAGLLPTPDVTPRQLDLRDEEMRAERTQSRVLVNPWLDSGDEVEGPASIGDEATETQRETPVEDTAIKRIEEPSRITQLVLDETKLTPEDVADFNHRKQGHDDTYSSNSLETDAVADIEVSSRDVREGRVVETSVDVFPSQPPKEARPTESTNKELVGTIEIVHPRRLPSQPALAADESHQPRTSYHDVWKITDYAPQFPLPARPIVQTTLDHATLARAPFEGTPLQELPKSQLARAAEAYRPPPDPTTQARPDPYPYSSSRRGGEGDWSVEIPPSPTSAYQRAPDDYRPARQTRRQSRSRSRRRRHGGDNGGRFTSRGGDLESGRRHEWDTPPVIERAFHAASVSFFQGLTVPMGLYRGFRDIYYPPPVRPDIIKAYPVRRKLPIRIFFPSHHDLTSPALLPTLFTIHGGGFTVGYASDDDKWNRTFADTYTVMVISLNYSKAPWACFPAPLHDTEALYHAVLNDESLPIDRMRTALCGFDAGANLALALSQLPSVKSGRDPNPPRFPPRAALNPTSSPMSPTTTTPDTRNLNRHRSMYFPTGAASLVPQGYRPNTHPASSPYHPPPLKSHPPPSAVIPICGILDFTTPASAKSHTRPYKRSLRGPRGWGPGFDWMARLLPSSAWSYIPYGHDTSDPLLSPVYAKRSDLPPHVFVIGAELDCLAHESWRAACSWAGAGNVGVTVPDGDTIVGRRGVSRWRGCLDDGEGLDGGKFGWVSYHRKDGNRTEDGEGEIVGSTRWLLVPDVVHGFDSAPWRNKYLWGDEEARMDAEMKTIAYQREMAEWLWGVVWK